MGEKIVGNEWLRFEKVECKHFVFYLFKMPLMVFQLMIFILIFYSFYQVPSTHFCQKQYLPYLFEITMHSQVFVSSWNIKCLVYMFLPNGWAILEYFEFCWWSKCNYIFLRFAMLKYIPVILFHKLCNFTYVSLTSANLWWFSWSESMFL